MRYLAVRLTGTASNRSALGAIVKVTAGGTTYMKVMDGSTGYLSHGVYPLYFGLGRRRASTASRSRGRTAGSRRSPRRSRSIRAIDVRDRRRLSRV